MKRLFNIDKRYFIPFLMLMMAIPMSSDMLHAQDSRKIFRKSYDIYFKVDKYLIDTSFRDNAGTIARMKKDIDSLLANGKISPDSIHIVSSASPDGGTAYNMALSEKRGKNTVTLIQSFYPQFTPATVICNPIGEDWYTLRKHVYDDPDFPDRDELLDLIDSDRSNEEKERMLKQKKTAFRYLLKNYVYLMRASSVTFNVSMPAIYLESVQPPVIPGPAASPGDIKTRPMETVATDMEKKMIFAARTNLLVPALNFGIEVPVGMNWSVGADYYFPWWLARDNRRCVEMLGWFIDGKYWFGKDRTEEEKLTGHALGMYAGGGYYDFQWLKSGHQGEFIDIGVDYTYAIPLAKDKLRMEFNIGIGWIGTQARHYTPTDDYTELIKDPGIRHRNYSYFGPTRASVSLVVPVRINARKGGAR